MVGEILILVMVMLLNAFFAASEMAIVSARRPRLKQRADDGHKGSAMALELAENSGKFLSSVQIGITVLGVFAGAYGGATFAEPLGVYFQPWFPERADDVAFGIVVTLITYFSLVVGELVPKRLAIAHAESLAGVVAYPMYYFAKIGAPIVWLLGKSSDLLLALLPGAEAETAEVIEEEVKTMIAEGADAGVFAPGEAQMLEGVMRLGDRTVRAIMTPRPEVKWLDITRPLDAQLDRLAELEFSRLPVARGRLDEIVGIIYAKDLLNAYLHGAKPDLVALLREPLTVHDATPVLRLVDVFRTSRQHFAIVVDEHGSVEGVVSATDVLATVTGTLPETLSDSESLLVARPDGSWLADGMMPIDEAMAHFDLRSLKTEEDDFHTLAGFVLKMLGHLPRAGERFRFEDYQFEVLDMDGRRIDKVLITPPAATETE